MFARLLTDEPWLVAAGIALAAVVAGLVLHRILARILQRATHGRAPVLHAMLVRAEAPAGAVLPLIALQMVWSTAPAAMHYMAAVRHVNIVLLICALTWLAMALIDGIADGVVAQRPTDISDNLHARRIETQARVLSRSAQTLALIAGAALVLMTYPSARRPR